MKEIKLESNKIKHSGESKNSTSGKKQKELNQIKENDSRIEKYICYTNDDNNSKLIWISFNNSEKAIKIKYNGQSESIPLKFVRNEYMEGGSYPTIIDYYDEIYNGKRNGTYKLTKSGNWYYVSYKRAKDGKEFNFTIDHTTENLSPQPCF